jgi:serine/threonine protein kinase/tetratricopeptide (TPR) repeat protein
MGEVWLAEDTLLRRPVAIKYMGTPESAFYREFFIAEARALARLQHPNITLIYDAVFDEERQQFYLVMEYVEGESLDDYLKTAGPLPLDVTLDIAIGVAQALQYAHERDIVHRDIKPSNVMLHNGQAKLTDFGLAQLISNLTEGADVIVGTLDYMSPEQILGGTLDGRTDLYALGGMLYEMVAGRTPFEDKSPNETMEAHVNVSPPSPKNFAPDIPVSLEYAIIRLLAKEPDDRYASAAELLQVLESFRTRQQASQSHLNLLQFEDKPLVGRTEELHQLNGIWQQVQDTHKPRLVVLSGEMGMGKTRLAGEFIGRTIIDQEAAVVAGKSDEFNLPYDPFSEILATVLNRELIAPLPQDQLDQLLVQIPDLARLLHLSSSITDLQSKDAGQVHWQFFATVLSILTQLAPAIIFIKNATTLDEASFDLLRFLLGREQLQLMFVVTSLNTPQTDAWFDTLSADEKHVIDLNPLSSPQVETFLTEWLGSGIPEPAVDLIQKRSGGIPLQIEVAANQLIKDGLLSQDESGQWHYVIRQTEKQSSAVLLPRSMTRIFSGRLQDLSEETREGLTLAALLRNGAEFDFDTWLTVLGGEAERDAAQQIIDEALRNSVIRRIDDHRYDFRPGGLGQHLLAELSDEQRQAMHRAIADILTESQASPVLIGYHYQQAGLTAEAAALLKEAGDKAIAGCAIDAAINYYNRSVELVESRPIQKTLGQLYHQTGNWKVAVDHYERALTLAGSEADLADQAAILNSLSLTLWYHDQYKEAYQRAVRVRKLSGVPETERAVAASHLGMISWLMGRLAEAEKWCRESSEALQNTADDAGLAGAYNRLGLVYFSQGRLAEAEEVFLSSLQLRQELEDIWGQAFCLNNLAKVAIDRGEFVQALSLLESAEELFQRIDSHDGLMVIYTNQGRMCLYQADAEQAMPYLTKALHLARRIGKHGSFGLSEIYLLIGQASLQLGKVKPAYAATCDALKIVEAAGNREYIANAHATLAQIYQRQDDQAAAETAYQQALALFEQMEHLGGLLRTRLVYAQYLAQTGEPDRAQTLTEQTRTKAKEIGLYLPQ